MKKSITNLKSFLTTAMLFYFKKWILVKFRGSFSSFLIKKSREIGRWVMSYAMEVPSRACGLGLENYYIRLVCNYCRSKKFILYQLSRYY
jgi:hypothetical protein